MADRSITTRLRLEIGDLKAKAREASTALKSTADAAKAATLSAADAEKVRAGVRKQAAAADVAANEQLKMQQEQYGKLTASVLANRSELETLAGAATKSGLLLAAGAGLAVKAYADFDKQMSAVAATGDDARQNIDGLRETAIKLGADTQYSAGEAAQGIEELLKAGVSAADVMGGGLAGALNLAAAGQIEVADAAETAATAMVQFNLSGKDVPHIADLLAAGAGKAQGGVSDLAMALKQSGLVASQFGLSIEETVGTLSAFASAGLLGSDAGTSFKTMLLRLANPADNAAAEMERLGIAAYDAQGNFVGIESLAGQLQDRLGGLTQAQRDQSLATIFGSDAIRAANVLYQQGAAGIADWKAQVDDAGYASETAATKTDNLAGDIERLGGALDTLLIKGGEGGQNALRSLVQSAEGLVEGLGNANPVMVQAGIAVAAVGAAALLGFAGLSKLTIGIVETRVAMATLAAQAPRTAAGIGLLSKAAGAAGLVVSLGMAVSALHGFNEAAAETAYSATEMLSAIEKMPVSLREIDSQFQFKHGVVLKDQVNGVAEAFKRVKEQAAGHPFQKWMDDVGLTNTVAGQARAQFERLDQTLASLDTNESAAAFKNLSKELYANGATAGDLVTMFPKTAEKARELAKSANFDIDKNGGVRALLQIMQGDLPPAMRASLEATEEGREALEAMGMSAGAAAESIEDLTEKLHAQADAALAAASAEIAFEQAIDDATEAAKTNGKTLDVNTEKGRANKSALIGLADSSRKYIEQLKQTEGSSKKVAEATSRSTAEFVKVARQMGLSEREAYKLALQYGLVPKKVSTDISAPGAKVTQADIDTINKFLATADEGARAEIISTFIDKGAKAAKEAIDKVKSKTVSITVQTFGLANARAAATFGASMIGGGWAGGQVRSLPVSLVPGFTGGGSPSLSNSGLRTSGGPVTGPWYGPKADNVLTRLNPREFVHPVSSVTDYGLGFMEAVRTGTFPKELAAAGVRGLADGGQPTQGWQRATNGHTTVVREQSQPSVSMPVQIYERPDDGRFIARELGREMQRMMGG